MFRGRPQLDYCRLDVYRGMTDEEWTRGVLYPRWRRTVVAKPVRASANSGPSGTAAGADPNPPN